MKYPLLLLFALFLGTRAPAQSLPASPFPDEYRTAEALETARLRHQQTAMLVLGGWALGNIGLGLALRSRRTGEDRRFHEMNALWNTVNLGIAGLGYLSVARTDPTALGAFASLLENQGLQKILLFNAGLDVGYLAGGFYLLERARRPDVDRDRLRGYGRSIILQGGFLLAFDLVNYFLAAGRNPDYAPLLGVTSEGVGLTLGF
ncbi:hypothetical protein GGR26_003380 [Lewinella marina]|uniref:Uncharacterized protein n=1 Tax=Neolewinella marina TaxID=438751 RepID=A0A2G0CCL4_9BACT|nr:hypothetical protein [Neolewinella marina]NJB87596.1 hypothetical protein [Neolewinella marina]PHK97714.1 hypothetical protein CGL56_14915 [Neolewinella marina]